MTEFQRLFLVQARSDFQVFELLRSQREKKELPSCHALHYLQMATEKFAKARAWRRGPPGRTHRGFRDFMKSLGDSNAAQKQLGYAGKNESWAYLIKRSARLAQSIQDLAPAGDQDKPNPEYPWPVAAPCYTPAEYDFKIWADLQDTDEGRQFLKFLSRLFVVAEAFLD
jgi:hypothetical protein